MQDKRAIKVLNDTFWSGAGWKPNPVTPPEDFAYAKSQGVMFDPVDWTHDDAVNAAIEAASKLTKDSVANGFIASMGSRRLDLRSALGSYAVARHMQRHSLTPRPGGPSCAYCGQYPRSGDDPNILNFERFKWGGVRHAHPDYIALDLSLFALQTYAPSAEDYEILRRVLDIVRAVPAKARLSDLEKSLAKLLPSNGYERRTLIAILGYAGVLVDPMRPDFRSQFVPVSDREQTPWYKDDWPYPVQWWTGNCGVQENAIEEWFPQLSHAP